MTLVERGGGGDGRGGSSPYAIVASDAQGSGSRTTTSSTPTGCSPSTPVLTVSNVTAADKVYDATTSALIDTASATLNGVIGTDVVTLDAAGKAGNFADKNVASARP